MAGPEGCWPPRQNRMTRATLPVAQRDRQQRSQLLNSANAAYTSQSLWRKCRRRSHRNLAPRAIRRHRRVRSLSLARAGLRPERHFHPSSLRDAGWESDRPTGYVRRRYQLRRRALQTSLWRHPVPEKCSQVLSLSLCSSPRSPDEINDDLRQLFALVFLQKMPGAGDRHVRLALRAGNEFLKDSLAASRHRIAVAESRQ